MLDAGAGEGQYAHHFARQRYCGVDLAVGDAAWDYSRLDALADLDRAALPRRQLRRRHPHRHHRAPARARPRAARKSHARWRPAALLLIAAPHEWEVHQAPHDYFRYTRYGLAVPAGEERLRGAARCAPAGGYFRLLARRLLNGLQFFTGGLRWLGFIPAAILLVPPALILPFLDSLDRDRNFTLGYICTARKRA